jgi:hypothetical protein
VARVNDTQANEARANDTRANDTRANEARVNDTRANNTEQWLHPQSDELLRMHVPRHVLVHNQVVGLQLNEYPWWLNLQGVRLVAAE